MDVDCIHFDDNKVERYWGLKDALFLFDMLFAQVDSKVVADKIRCWIGKVDDVQVLRNQLADRVED